MSDNSWQTWLAQQREQVVISLEQVKLLDEKNMAPWYHWAEGVFCRDDKLFWSVTGQRVTVTKNGQQSAQWSQPFIKTEEADHGYLVLVETTTSKGLIPVFLICADIAPGRGTLELRPTLQASKSKLEMQPNFPRHELVKMVDRFVTVHCDSNIFKSKTISVGRVHFFNEDDFVANCMELRSNERWFSHVELRQAILAGELGDHLLTALAVTQL